MLRFFKELLGRKKRFVMIALIFTLLSVGAITSTVLTSGAVAARASVVFDNVLAMLAGRTPGERGAAYISKGKPSGHALGKKPAVPHERALGKVFEPRVPTTDKLAFPNSDIPPAWMPPLESGAPFPDRDYPGPPGGPHDNKYSPPPSPVPELSTWASMVIGLGFCGAALRHKRRRRVPA